MKYSKKDISLENGLIKEWIITNGIGGYASSSIIGCNTRKYHGLLIAPLTPPARRFLILSKIDESIEIEGKKYNLYTNISTNYISDGYKYQETFEKDYLPTFSYKVEDILINKTICMKYMENTVCILYKIKNVSSLRITTIRRLPMKRKNKNNDNLKMVLETTTILIFVTVLGFYLFNLYINIDIRQR